MFVIYIVFSLNGNFQPKIPHYLGSTDNKQFFLFLPSANVTFDNIILRINPAVRADP